MTRITDVRTLVEQTVQSRYIVLSYLLGVFMPVPESLMSVEAGVPGLDDNGSSDELDEEGAWAEGCLSN